MAHNDFWNYLEVFHQNFISWKTPNFGWDFFFYKLFFSRIFFSRCMIPYEYWISKFLSRFNFFSISISLFVYISLMMIAVKSVFHLFFDPRCLLQQWHLKNSEINKKQKQKNGLSQNKIKKATSSRGLYTFEIRK